MSNLWFKRKAQSESQPGLCITCDWQQVIISLLLVFENTGFLKIDYCVKKYVS
jgi:hypothetical protein